MKKYLQDNYGGVGGIIKNLRDLKFNIKALIFHIYNNNFKLKKVLLKSKKVNFGSGTDIKKDFINIDMNGLADIFLDVRNKSNIPSSSIELIYSSHFIEHLEHHELISHFKECFRILKKDGTLRLGVPKFENTFNDYCSGNKVEVDKQKSILSKKFNIDEKYICRMDLINRSVYEFGHHKICLDSVKVKNLLIFCGFEDKRIKIVDFDNSIDVKSRKDDTFFIEIIK